MEFDIYNTTVNVVCDVTNISLNEIFISNKEEIVAKKVNQNLIENLLFKWICLENI